ncbi:GspE/PulE family protein [Methylobacterium oxalidis]|uniref:Type II secretion system protein GspE n=1 Tax=Methylobacterium oxalidis TaxID=944322 RepID=A0A512IZL8_9HYPH|nr:GspE/PulE family protein [Methylobacterium oxalidis]GEP03103.1 type II secretion system protein GspE [Methylobacterium oxalidis]GJE31736.1 Type II secretion system protein E [Methylobacterium oxalidis]GLS67362.1 type II secretion system protein GspE [Methylobacterium oxalidis]
MLSIWAGKSRPRHPRPDRRGAGRAGEDPARRFLDALAEAQVLDAGGHERALTALDLPGRRPLPLLLTEFGLVHETTLVSALADATGLPFLRDEEVPGEPVLPGLIGADYCARARVLPLRADATRLDVAAVDVFDPEVPAALAHLTDREVAVTIVGPSAFERAHRAVYGDAAPEDHDGIGADDDLARLQDVASQAPIVRLAARLVRKAFELSASDIHVEAEEADVRVRYRVDGVLIESERLARSVQLPLTTRIKILAGLNIAERRLPQDGRMKVQDRGRDVDIRVSTLPTAHGESVVLRVLDGSRRVDDFSGLGFDAAAIAQIAAMTARPNGLVLVTGPTGSGKTTTLYAALRRLNGTHLKIVTVEDPVEYRMPGVNQVQAHPGIGLDFAAALRSILRQDPDVVMVGEIRDGETARIAVQAALTGHLVISTLHTNSAPATVTRLVDMGVAPFLIAATLNGVVAQRLVRRVCDACAEAAPATAEERIRLRVPLADPGSRPLTLRRACGCPACNGSGYRGRMVVSEIMPLDATLRGLISEGADERTLEGRAREAGMASLADTARARVLSGDTTLDEVGRVFEGLL